MLYFDILKISARHMEPTQQNSSPILPIAIITGFAMIAIAIFFTNQGGGSTNQVTSQTPETEQDQFTDGVARTVDESDYILGNPNAPIVMIEYSDYDCPFCKQYHTTMHQIMDEYGVTGRIAWVYRQFPLAELHPNAPKVSEAALCVGDIGGNDAFWTFSDLVFDGRNLDQGTNVTKLIQYAETSGVDNSQYSACMNEGRMKQAVENSIRDGFDAGARGTPYTILLVGNQQAVINGAQPYDVVKGIVENLIDQLDGNFDTSAAGTAETPANQKELPVLE
jgi:protein-disulfide isomerase